MRLVVGPETHLHGAEQAGIRPHHPPRQPVDEHRERQRQRRAHQHHQTLHAQHRPQRGFQVLHHQHAPAEGRSRRGAAQLGLRHQRRSARRPEAQRPAVRTRRAGREGAQGHGFRALPVFDQRPAVGCEYPHRQHRLVAGQGQHFIAPLAEPRRVQFGEQQPLRPAGRIAQGQADIDAVAPRGAVVGADAAGVAERQAAGSGLEQGPVGDRFGQLCGAAGGQHLATRVGHRDDAVDRRDPDQPLQFGAHLVGLAQVAEGHAVRQQLQLGAAAFEGA